MEMKRAVLVVLNRLISIIVILALILVGAYAIYALWDNNRIYVAAENVQEDMMNLKPEVGQDETGADFSELLKINKDVCAWITLDNTQIDYPVLQGDTNLTYINTDVYGNFSLAGSIYLDSRNSKEFTDCYSLLYGHHMDKNRMFGDLELYKNESFFMENRTGTLILPGQSFELEILSCMLVTASDEWIFDPTQCQGNAEHLLAYIKHHSIHLNEDVLQSAYDMGSEMRLVAFSTCSYEYSNARTIVVALIKTGVTTE